MPKHPADPWWYTLLEEVSPGDRRSMPLRTQLELLIAEGGSTRHSARGLTLPFLLTRLCQAGVPFTLRAFPGKGYTLEVPPPGKGREIGGEATMLVDLRETTEAGR